MRRIVHADIQGMRRINATLFGLVLIGCAADSVPGVNGPVDWSGVDSIEEFYELSLQRYCQVLFRCKLASDDLIAYTVVLGSPERCVSVYRRALQPQSNARTRALVQLEAAGRVHVDQGALERCFEGADECAVLGPAAGTCRDIIEGVVAQGEACGMNEECAGEAYCDFSTKTCPGTCQARVAVGEACHSHEMCAGSAHCALVNNQSRCLADSIAPIGKQGESCVVTAAQPLPCAAGLFCDVPKIEGNDAPTGQCRPPIAVGAACDDNDDVCEVDALCHGPAGAQRCQRVQRLGLGDPCKSSDTEAPHYCDPFAGLTCGSSGCEALGDGSAGARCGTDDVDQFVPCHDGLFCNRDSLSCEVVRAAGASCGTNRQCASGACDPMTSQCREKYCAP
jgi:hypothetical protein